MEEAFFTEAGPKMAMATRMGVPCIGADWSMPSLQQQEAKEEDLPHFHAMQYQAGDRVFVWSNGKQCWLQGKVEMVWLGPGDTVADGYTIQAGTVKVQSEAGVKWIVPENVEVHLQKVDKSSGSGARASTAGGGSPTAGAGSPTC